MKKVLFAVLLCVVIACPVLAEESADSSGFVLLSEAVPDAILEIRYYSTYNFVGKRINGYEAPVRATGSRFTTHTVRRRPSITSRNGQRISTIPP